MCEQKDKQEGTDHPTWSICWVDEDGDFRELTWQGEKPTIYQNGDSEGFSIAHVNNNRNSAVIRFTKYITVTKDEGEDV